MYLVITASSDTYITNKIVNNKFRVKDANLGRASTLDLFKLYDESFLTGSNQPIELSRLLVKFDLERLRALTSSILDPSHSSFTAKLQMTDISSGRTVPENFNIVVHPLSKSFDEGIGRDVALFNDIGSANFITSSFSNSTVNAWTFEGANKEGLLGSNDIDIVGSGNLSDGNGAQQILHKAQAFTVGDEDLDIDVTTILSATLAEQVPDYGFRLSYSGSQETDSKTRFVKRFASRHVTNPLIRPRLVVTFDDSIEDHHENFFFDLSGSVFLKNYHRGIPSNVLTSSAGVLSDISGDNCMLVTLRTGSFKRVFTASQHKVGSISQTGVYSASFLMASNESNLVLSGTTAAGKSTVKDFFINSGSLVFEEYWGSIDETVGYHTGSLEIKSINRVAYSGTPKNYQFSCVNLQNDYNHDDEPKIRVFINDPSDQEASRFYNKKTNSYVGKLYYRIVDAHDRQIIIPFVEKGNGTRLSSDSDGYYFEFHMENLPIGRSYQIELLVIDHGVRSIESVSNSRFRITA